MHKRPQKMNKTAPIPDKAENEEQSVSFGRLPDYVGYQVRQAQASIFRDFEAITAATGLTPGEFSLLTVIEANPGIDQVTLARLYRLDKSTLSYSVTRLKGRGLIARRRSTDDRRRYSLSLTEIGRAALVRATEMVEDQERRMASALGHGGRRQLLGLLRRVSGSLNR